MRSGLIAGQGSFFNLTVGSIKRFFEIIVSVQNPPCLREAIRFTTGTYIWVNQRLNKVVNIPDERSGVGLNNMVKLLSAHGGCLGRDCL